MSEEQATIQRPKRRIGKWIARGVAVCLVWIVFAFLASSPAMVEFPIRFLAGWAFHAWKNLPPLIEQWPSLVLPIACLAIAGFLTHRFIRWWLKEKSNPLVWKPVQTISSVALILLGAGAAIAMSGIAHQSAWLSSEKWFENTGKNRTRSEAAMNAKQLILELMSYHEHHGHYPNTLEELRKESNLPSKVFSTEATPKGLREPFILLKPGGIMSLYLNEPLVVSPMLTGTGFFVVGYEDGSARLFYASEFDGFFRNSVTDRNKSSSSDD